MNQTVTTDFIQHSNFKSHLKTASHSNDINAFANLQYIYTSGGIFTNVTKYKTFVNYILIFPDTWSTMLLFYKLIAVLKLFCTGNTAPMEKETEMSIISCGKTRNFYINGCGTRKL